MELLIDLDEHGDLLDPRSGDPVTVEAVPSFLRRLIQVPESATDIIVFVHGWRTGKDRAERNADRLFSGVDEQLNSSRESYRALTPFESFSIAIRWPSQSSPGRRGYARIRERAHAMTTSGNAGRVIAHILGYLNQHRRPPLTGPARLRTATGQYLHCVGHSFGGRFLCEAIRAGGPARPATLSWPWPKPGLPFTVDTLLVFQMAAQPDIFSTRFAALLTHGPINCPIVLTRSSADRAVGLWHRLAEGVAGIGNIGATTPADKIATLPLLSVTVPYARADLAHPIVNIDASARYRRGRLLPGPGAHSDYWYPESFHLLLSLMALARTI